MQFTCDKKSRRGISTVLGVLLMVGILFTTVIPVFIYVNSLNNYYDLTVVNMKIADQERSREEMEVYAWGRNDSVDVYMINRGSMSLNVMRIWFMGTYLNKTLIFTSENESSPLPLQLIASSQETVTLSSSDFSTIIDADPDLNHFNIYVTTARGNKFPSRTNPLRYDEGWIFASKPPWITVFIYSDQGDDNYRVTAVCEDSGKIYNREYYHINGYFSFVIDVTEFSSYNVTAWNIKINGEENYQIDSMIVHLDLETWVYSDIAPAPFDDLEPPE